MPSLERLPVALRFVVAYLAGAALFAAVFILRLVTSHRDQLVAEVAKKGDAVTRLFARGLTTPLFHLDVNQIQSQVHHVKTLQDVRDVLVFNERGQCVTDGTDANPRLGDVLPEVGEVVARPEPRPREQASPGRLRYTTAVVLGDRPIGGVQLDFSLDAVAAQVKRLQEGLVMTALVLIALGALPVWLVSNYFLKPLLFGDEG